MAILNNGINGAFRGKVGSVVGYIMYGKQVVRALPKLSKKNKRGSAQQKRYRTKFTLMQHFLNPLLYFIRVGFNLESKERENSAYNAAKSYNMLNAFDGDSKIACEKVCVSFGKLDGALGANVTKADQGLEFSWLDNSNYAGMRKPTDALCSDQVMLLAYDVKGGRATFTTSGARRHEKQAFLLMHEDDRGKEIDIWMAFIADNRMQISTSNYLGRLVY